MKVNLIGVQNLENLKMRDGTVIDGVKLHLAYPKQGVSGCCVEAKFISREIWNGFGLDVNKLVKMAEAGVEVIDVEYGPSNRIVGISV